MTNQNDNFTQLKRQFNDLRNDFSERKNTFPKPAWEETIGYPAAIACLLEGLPIETAKNILTASIGVIEKSNTVRADEIYKNFGSHSSQI